MNAQDRGALQSRGNLGMVDAVPNMRATLENDGCVCAQNRRYATYNLGWNRVQSWCILLSWFSRSFALGKSMSA
ncbi:hypothetical protein SAMN04515669_0794 [Jiangella sp. DSM 45060]|nr:hypothetical protein SAMN04515669_0794 [Jiangella sp. DSM 45060]